MAHQTVRDWDDDLVPSDSGRTNAPHADCPVEAALAVVSGRWSTLLLRELFHGPRTFSGFREVLPGLSDKVLHDRLVQLVNLGVVERRRTRGFPNRVEYRLTDAGHHLRPLLQELYRTGEALLDSRSQPTRLA